MTPKNPLDTVYIPTVAPNPPSRGPRTGRRRALLAAVLAATFAAPLVFAQPPMGPPDDAPGMRDGRGSGRHWERMHERMEQHFEQLEQALKLRPEQKPAWDAFAAARPQPAQRTPEEWRAWREQMQSMGAIERHRAMEQRLEERLTQMRASGVALQKLYDVLDAGQRATLDRFQWWPGPKDMKPGRGGPGPMSGQPGPGPAPAPAPAPAQSPATK